MIRRIRNVLDMILGGLDLLDLLDPTVWVYLIGIGIFFLFHRLTARRRLSR